MLVFAHTTITRSTTKNMNHTYHHNKRTPLLFPLLAISALAVNAAKGQTVFLDTFSQPGQAAGTLLVGSSADVGGVWSQNGTSANGLTISPENSINTQGNGRQVFDSFTSTLGRER